MRRFTVLFVTGLLVAGLAAPAGASHRFSVMTTMTYNLYVGADLGSLNPGLILPTIVKTNFPERAQAIAAEIDRRNPDVIGLQEVSDLSVTFADGTPVPGQPQLDYLDILLDALEARGEKYVVASEVVNAEVSLPLDDSFTVFGNLTDRDVILARSRTTSTSNARSGNYRVNFAVPGLGIEFTRGWTSVDAKVGGAQFTFVNTHLEVEPDFTTFEGICLVESAPVPCQIPQAEELVNEVLAKSEHPTVLLGDFNAEPGTTAYDIIKGAGLADAWNDQLFRHRPGFTCCQDEQLDNEKSKLDQRIDQIWLGKGVNPRFVLAGTVGDRWWQKTPSGLWPSDHAGVVAYLIWR